MDSGVMSHTSPVTSNHTTKDGPYCPLRVTDHCLLRAEAVPLSPLPVGYQEYQVVNTLAVQPLACMSLLPTL